MSRTANNEREVISELTTGRLSVYLRCLTFLESQGQKTVSSGEMAERFHLNSAQFGTRGVGYDVSRLRAHLIETLGIDRTRNVLIAGAGNLGMALADYHGFNSNGFHLVAIVDTDPEKIGKTSRSGIRVLPWERMTDVVRRNHVDIGIVAVPAEHAQTVHDALADAGIHAILNFAPTQIKLRPDVKVRSVDLRINLESLSFHLKNAEDGVLA